MSLLVTPFQEGEYCEMTNTPSLFFPNLPVRYITVFCELREARKLLLREEKPSSDGGASLPIAVSGSYLVFHFIKLYICTTISGIMNVRLHGKRECRLWVELSLVIT